MRKFRIWFFRQKAVVRFFVMFALTSSVATIFMLLVNALSGEPWYRGITGGVIAGALLSAWSLSDKKFYEEQQEKTDKKNKP